MSQTTMSQTTKTAQQIIDEWVAKGDLNAELDLNGFTEIPKLPDTVRRLSVTVNLSCQQSIGESGV